MLIFTNKKAKTVVLIKREVPKDPTQKIFVSERRYSVPDMALTCIFRTIDQYYTSERDIIAAYEHLGYEYCRGYSETSKPEFKEAQCDCIGITILVELLKNPKKSGEIGLESYCHFLHSCDLRLDLANSIANKAGFVFLCGRERITASFFTLGERVSEDEGAKNPEQPPKKPTPEKDENPFAIKRILFNKEKKVVVVFFKDGTKEVKHCDAGDEFDVEIGVALAVAKHVYGTTKDFKKLVERKAKPQGGGKGK